MMERHPVMPFLTNEKVEKGIESETVIFPMQEDTVSSSGDFSG